MTRFSGIKADKEGNEVRIARNGTRWLIAIEAGESQREVSVWGDSSVDRVQQHVRLVDQQGFANVPALPGEITAGPDREWQGEVRKTWRWSLPEETRQARKAFGPRDTSAEVSIQAYKIALNLYGGVAMDSEGFKTCRSKVKAGAKQIAEDLNEVVAHIRELARKGGASG